jgi:putative transposase
LTLIERLFHLDYLLLDGKYGNNYAVQMARQVGLHLLSKLRHDSELYLPYQGSDRRCHYGERIKPRQMSQEFLVSSSTEEGIRTETYQVKNALHKKFAQPLNLVIIVKTNLKTQAQAHVILFSTDLTLSYELLIDYYVLRFQIEFNFRDAKQFWGLEDFMNTSETGVTNAANLYGQCFPSPVARFSAHQPFVECSGFEGGFPGLQVCRGNFKIASAKA